MLLTTVAIAGGAVVTGSVKLYRENKRKKEFPWTVAAERMAKKRRKKSFVDDFMGVKLLKNTNKKRLPEEFAQVLSLASPHDSDSKRLEGEDSQSLDFSLQAEKNEICGAEKEMNRYLGISLTCLGLTTAGIYYPALSLVSLPALAYLSTFFFKTTYNLIKKEGRIGIGVIDGMFFAGTLATGHYFAASVLCSLYYTSQKLLVKTEDHSRNSLINLFGEETRFVWVYLDEIEAEIEISFDALKVGDIVVVGAGQMIPVDGTIIRGHARIDQRILTGESQPVEKGINSEVFASTVVLDGKIYIQIEKAGASTVAAKIADILNRTADFKSSIQSRGEKIVDQGAIPTLALSVLALPLLGSSAALAVLNSSFGYHMRISAPISVLNFLRIASQHGVLIKDGRSLELLSQIDTIVFDKTGTLTEEIPTVSTIVTCHDYSKNDVLTYAAAAEYKQTHPIAQAIQQEAERRELTVPPISDAKYEVGYGLKVRVGETQAAPGVLVRVGSARFMEMEEITIPAEIKKTQAACHADGNGFVYVAIDNQLAGAIELCATVRPEAKALVRTLQKRNISVVIISGDHEKPTQKLAESLGIDQYFAQVLPQDKARLIEELQEQGKSVCFVGDGINDSIALKTANVSISLSGASTIATDTAGIILMDGSLKSLIQLLDIANELDRNLSISTMMTIVPGIICVGGVFFFHFGLLTSIILYNTALALSVSNAIWPLLKHQRKQLSQSNSEKHHLLNQ